MRYAVSIIAILFSLLHIAAAVTQFKSKDPAARGSAVWMVSGGVLLLCAAVPHLIRSGGAGWMDALTAGVGGVFVCFAAVLNGKRAGKVHPVHHIVRGIIVALLIVGFVLW